MRQCGKVLCLNVFEDAFARVSVATNRTRTLTRGAPNHDVPEDRFLWKIFVAIQTGLTPMDRAHVAGHVGLANETVAHGANLVDLTVSQMLLHLLTREERATHASLHVLRAPFRDMCEGLSVRFVFQSHGLVTERTRSSF